MTFAWNRYEEEESVREFECFGPRGNFEGLVFRGFAGMTAKMNTLLASQNKSEVLEHPVVKKYWLRKFRILFHALGLDTGH